MYQRTEARRVDFSVGKCLMLPEFLKFPKQQLSLVNITKTVKFPFRQSLFVLTCWLAEAAVTCWQSLNAF